MKSPAKGTMRRTDVERTYGRVTIRDIWTIRPSRCIHVEFADPAGGFTGHSFGNPNIYDYDEDMQWQRKQIADVIRKKRRA